VQTTSFSNEKFLTKFVTFFPNVLLILKTIKINFINEMWGWRSGGCGVVAVYDAAV
jgi:hypothetical protein